MSYIVLDLEATCWPVGTRPERMETIEFGAVRLDKDSYEALDEYSSFVRPVSEPSLSEFCKNLTSIRQSDVDAAPLFPDAFQSFLGWIGPGPSILCSWGAYDVRQLRVDCRRHGIVYPDILGNHLNLKTRFAEVRNRKPCGMKKALLILGIEPEGSHHRAIDDARNIARIAKTLLTRAER